MPTRFNKSLDTLYVKLSGSAAKDIYCIGARYRDQFNTMPELRMEFFTTDIDFDPQKILGKDITLTTDGQFKVSGIIISIEELGFADSDVLYAAEIRPKHWLTTVSASNQVFQGKSADEIVKEVLKSVDVDAFKSKLSTACPKRDYCVQYGETNFAFISRLLEEEGIYYYFDHSGAAETMVLCDSVSANIDAGKISFAKATAPTGAMDTESVQVWTEKGRVAPGKVSLFDYDPMKSKTKLEATALAAGEPANKKVEAYLASGHYTATEVGDKIAQRDVESLVAETRRFTGSTNHPKLVTGAFFDFDHPDLSDQSVAYLTVASTHYIACDATAEDREASNHYHDHVQQIDYPKDMIFFQSEFEVQPKSVQFRPRRLTPWPEVPSFLTAIVTGKPGEEIYTDDHGRIKVKFPWDRNPKGDDTTSCWVRTVMPWAGNGWGWQSIPRVGMEVIIQFERGNIDRPYCTGMVYNDINKLPYAKADEITKTGLRTNSSKGGGGFHELTFDDKKGAEKIFFQSEKDYQQLVKNNAAITIGLESENEGNLTQTIRLNKDETIKEGNVTLKIDKGSRTTTIKTDETTTIEGKSTTEITGNTTLTVKTGNLEETVSTGNQKTTVSAGNVTLDATAGQITITAAIAIELKVGANSIKIDQTGVTITGTKITVDGKAMTEVKAPLVNIKGMAMIEAAAPLIKLG